MARKTKKLLPLLDGYSLSRCVGDIVEGRVRIEQVRTIYSRTAWPTQTDIDMGIELYKTGEWRQSPERMEGFPDRAEKIAKILFEQGKVVQPRLETGIIPPLLDDRFHWVNAETGVVITSRQMEAAARSIEIECAVGVLTSGRNALPGQSRRMRRSLSAGVM